MSVHSVLSQTAAPMATVGTVTSISYHQHGTGEVSTLEDTMGSLGIGNDDQDDHDYRYLHAYIHYMHAYIHAYTHTYIHAYIHSTPNPNPTPNLSPNPNPWCR